MHPSRYWSRQPPRLPLMFEMSIYHLIRFETTFRCEPLNYMALIKKKDTLWYPFTYINGGADGTRTRDLRRDRPAF